MGRARLGQKIVSTVFALLVATSVVVAIAAIQDWRQPDAAAETAVGAAVDAAGRPVVPVAVAYDDDRSRELGGEALALVRYDWRTELPGWTIEFVRGEGNVAGFTWSQERRMEIFVRDTDTATTLARVLAHEIGHAVDLSKNDSADRQQWLEQRNAAGTAWWPASGRADFESGAGDFAEVFAAWQIGDDDFRSRVGAAPTESDYALMSLLAFDRE